MPELPEVETVVKDLNKSLLIGVKISSVEVFWTRTIATLEISDFLKRIRNQTIERITRRGKFIVMTLTNYTLLVHLRMTGKFSLSKGKEVTPHERVRVHLNDGRFLHYEDQRKFGKWYLVENPEDKFGLLGIEPLSKEFTLEAFQNILKKSTQQIKPFLLNQRHIVGLGNIYADEALWEAKIHPKRTVQSLKQKEIKELHQAIPKVLKLGIAHMGTSLGSKLANYFSVNGRRGGNQTQLKVFRRDGLLCSRCQTVVAKIKLAQRGTHFCPHCQK